MNDLKKSNIFKTYSKKLLNFIRGKTNSEEDAEDILQEVGYQLSRIADIDTIENISAWLYSVSRNKITDLYRKKKETPLENYAQEDEEGNINFKEILLMDTSNNPELEMFKDLFWEELFLALDELPENQKLVFVENELEDKTLQQIADEQNIPLKTIISRKGYALKHLRKRLLPLYNEFVNS